MLLCTYQQQCQFLPELWLVFPDKLPCGGEPIELSSLMCQYQLKQNIEAPQVLINKIFKRKNVNIFLPISFNISLWCLKQP